MECIGDHRHAAAFVQGRKIKDDDARGHDDAEDHVDHGHRLVPPEHDVGGREQADEDEGMPVFDVEVGGEKVGEPHEHGCRIGDHEDEDHQGPGKFQERAVVSFFEVFAHGADPVADRYLLDLPSEHTPHQEHACQGVDPEAGVAEIPANLAGEADEEHGTEIGRAV